MDLTEVDCKTTRTDPFWDAEPDIGGVRIHHVSNDAGFVNGRGQKSIKAHGRTTIGGGGI